MLEIVRRQAISLNKIISFLAKRDLTMLSQSELLKLFGLPKSDMIILLGNSSLRVAETAAQAYTNGLASKILICGGKGHSTSYLYDNIKKSKYQEIQTADKSEAELFYEVLTTYHKIDKNALLLETLSTNCGSNAEETQKLLRKINLYPRTVLILQDPVLQRRSEASFQKVFEGENIQFISYASFIPLVKEQQGVLVYEDENDLEFCAMDRFLSLVMGEVPRLLDNENGYGPKGKNFIAPVTVPKEIEESYQDLLHSLGSDYKGRTNV